MQSKSITVLDFRDEYPCEHCFLDRLKQAYDARYLATRPEYELLIITPDQGQLMAREAHGRQYGAIRLDSWWGVPISVQEA